MPGTIYFKDTRDPNGIDHIAQRCLLFKNGDTAALNPVFHLTAFLPDGERFFLPAGDSLAGQDPMRSFTIPADVDSPIQAVVNVSNPDWAGHDNRLTCEVFIVPDGGTLSFDGTNYSVIQPTIPPNTSKPKTGCLPMMLMGLLIIFGIGYLLT